MNEPQLFPHSYLAETVSEECSDELYIRAVHYDALKKQLAEADQLIAALADNKLLERLEKTEARAKLAEAEIGAQKNEKEMIRTALTRIIEDREKREASTLEALNFLQIFADKLRYCMSPFAVNRINAILGLNSEGTAGQALSAQSPKSEAPARSITEAEENLLRLTIRYLTEGNYLHVGFKVDGTALAERILAERNWPYTAAEREKEGKP